MRSLKSIQIEHDNYHERKSSDFDFLCIAHEPDYQPRYLEDLDEDCHGMLSDGYCSENCKLCPLPCPIVPCPFGDE